MEKRERKVWIIITFVMLIIVICAINIFGRKDNNANDDYFINDELAYNPELLNSKGSDEISKSRKSDIEGWTLYDKKKAGLSILVGSDTDYDGLTDKEEIEIYGSDPLKTSTSGDLYTDGYKVKNGMDLNTVYEDGEITYLYVADNVSPSSDNANDNACYIEKRKAGDENAYDCYTITRFSGNGLDVNVEELCEKEELKAEKLGCYMKNMQTGEYENVDYTVDGNVISVSYDFANDQGYNLYVTKKKSIPSDFSRMLFGDARAEELERILSNGEYTIYNGYNKNEHQGLITMPFLITYLFGGDGIATPTIYYNKDLSEEEVEIEKERLYKIVARQTTNKDVKVKYKASTTYDIVKKYNKLEGVFNGFFNANHDNFLHNSLFSYLMLQDWDDEYVRPEKENEPRTYMNIADFDIVTDTLPFPNYRYGWGTYGNCVGIATLIAKIYNTGTNPSQGVSNYFSDDALSWDISIDKENKTLTDPILNDYKDASWKPSDHMTPGEIEFCKMINAYFADGNRQAQSNSIFVDGRSDKYSIEALREVCHTYLDNKVLLIGLNSGSAGHDMNLYGYKDNVDIDGTMELYIYDNNLPGEKSANLVVNVIAHEDGSFDFDYNPNTKTLLGENYGYTSFGCDSYLMSIQDEEHNVLFGTKKDLLGANPNIIEGKEIDENEEALKKLLEEEW